MQRFESVGVLRRGGCVEKRLPALCPLLASFGVRPRPDATEGLLEGFVAALAHGVRGADHRGVADELGRAHALPHGFALEQLPVLLAEPHSAHSHRHDNSVYSDSAIAWVTCTTLIRHEGSETPSPWVALPYGRTPVVHTAGNGSRRLVFADAR